MGLHSDGESRARVPRDLEEPAHTLRGVVRQADVPDLAGFEERLRCGHLVLDGGVLVVKVEVIQVDVIGAESLEGLVEGGHDILPGQSLPVRLRTDLGRDDDLPPGAPLRHPLADDRLRLAALVALRPHGVHVRRVDHRAPTCDEGVEDAEGLLLVRGPPEGVAAEREGEHVQVRAGDTGHRSSPWVVGQVCRSGSIVPHRSTRCDAGLSGGGGAGVRPRGGRRAQPAA